MNLKEMREKRARLLAEARQILDHAESEKRSVNDDESTRYDALIAEMNGLSAQIEQAERAQERRGQLEDLERNYGQAGGRSPRPEPGEQRSQSADVREAPEYLTAYRSYLRGGIPGLAARDYQLLQSVAEKRGLQMDNDIKGGFLSPMTMLNRLIKGVDDQVYIRQFGTANQSTTSLGAPSIDADPADADWTSEIGNTTEDDTMTFGLRELDLFDCVKLVLISRKLLRARPDVENLVIDRIRYKFAITREKGYMTGNGVNKPLGLFTASNFGISTGRDVSTGNTQTAMTADGLLEAKYTLKGAYWARAKWMFHRDGVKQLAKLKDGEGQYMWKDDGIRAGEPPTFSSIPVLMSEYVPNTFTAGLYTGLIGDLSYYWYNDSTDLEIQILNELYAKTRQVGIMASWPGDGLPVLEEAFVRVKLAP